MLTGATGLVGSHAAAALVGAGHAVRALIRDEERLRNALAEVAPALPVEAVHGDMTDPASVVRAVEGCDAVVHAAAVVGVAHGAGGSDANLLGTRRVIEAALAVGADPIVYTSSLTAYLPAADGVVTPDTPLAEPQSAYARSKRDVERFVREHQRRGAPVTTLVLGAVYGPSSPHADGGFEAMRSALAAGVMLAPPSGMTVIDVRDLAQVIVRSLTPGRGPRRHLAGGQYLSWGDWSELLAAAAGLPVHRHEIGIDALVQLGRTFDERRREGDVASPLSEEAARIMASGVPTDDSATLRDLGVRYRPLTETFSDAVAFLRRRGLIAAPVGEA
jgi:UDP-glucose 4-epimerase